MTDLYIDARGTLATAENRVTVEAWLAEQDAVAVDADLTATAAAVQAYIDNDAKLSTVNGLSAAKDTAAAAHAAHGSGAKADPAQVLLTLPTDADPSVPFWRGAHATIVNAYGGKAVDANTVRVRKDKAISHLGFIAAMLPEPE